jgi:hypothetical protein
MSLPNNYVCEGQMSIEDVFSPDLWFGRMSPEPSAPTKERTSDVSSKKQSKSSVKMPLFLCLRNGHHQDASWETDGASLGEYTMLSFGEYPNEERGSRLSQILEDHPHQKYSLSARACQGILNRAERRGKTLPEQLQSALIRQSACKETESTEQIPRDAMEEDGDRESAIPLTQSIDLPYSAFKNALENLGGGKGILIQHERTGALSTLNNQSVLSVDEKMGNTYIGEDIGNTLGAREYKQPQAVCYGISSYESNAMKSSNPHSGIYEAESSRTLDMNGGNPNCNQGGVVVLGLDRASFNQGKNALYDFSIEEEKAQTIVAKGPGGVLSIQ